MKYRSEIDGLRAIAVVPVILFHAGVSLFSGGYVGVDVFFVISGYLITTIILTEKEAGKFSLIGFYERRARRILPALFFVILCSLPFAWAWMMPVALKDFAQSIVAVNFFASNILLWLESGYFAAAAELKPFLHTWSLAVEEQFYLVFPLFVIVFWRFGIRVITTLVILGFLFGLGISEWASTRYPSANFYLTPMRGWELLIGVMLAQYLMRKAVPQNVAFREIGAALGLALILVAIFSFDESTRFPGIYALVPTVGTAMIILFAQRNTLVGRLLSLRGFVGIGLISYSAYLWHQPLYAFARIRSYNEPGMLLMLGLAASAIVLAWFSWKFVEKPFRNRSRISRVQIFAFSGIIGVLLVGVGMAGYLSNGSPSRSPEFTANRSVFDDNVPPSLASCDGNIPKTGECEAGGEGLPTIAILGDSHAQVLANHFTNTFGATDLNAVQLAKGGCIPILNLTRENRGGECKRYNDEVYEYLLTHDNIDTIIIAARWTIDLEGTRFNNQEGGIEPGAEIVYLPVNTEPQHLTADGRVELIAQYVVGGIERLLDMDKRVILVYPVPEIGRNPARVAWHNIQFNDQSFVDIELSTSMQVFEDRNRRSYAMLDSVSSRPNLSRVFPAEIFCDTFIAGRCVAVHDGVQYYRDDDHLSEYGVREVNGEISKLLAN